MDFPGGSDGKETGCNAGDLGSILGLGRSPGEGNVGPLQYSCLKNPMDRRVWWATVSGVSKSQTRLSDWAHTQLASSIWHLRNFFSSQRTRHLLLFDRLLAVWLSKLLLLQVSVVSCDKKDFFGILKKEYVTHCKHSVNFSFCAFFSLPGRQFLHHWPTGPHKGSLIDSSPNFIVWKLRERKRGFYCMERTGLQSSSRKC